MNGAAQVVGSFQLPDSPFGHAFLWRADKGMQDLGDLRGGAGSIAWAINGKGQVVGESYFDVPDHRALPSHMFVWQADKGMQDLGSLTPESRPRGINNLGQIVGGPEGESSGNPPFLYSDGKMIDLNTTIDPASGWQLITATGINDSGQIVGDGKNKAGQPHAFLLTPVPSASVQSPLIPPPQSRVEAPTKPQTPAKPEASLSRNEKSVPTGLVNIVNRKTGLAMHWGTKQIETAGDYSKIRCQEFGKYLALENWALEGEKVNVRHNPGVLRLAPDAGGQSEFWKFEPIGDGYWRIVNRATGQCLVPRDDVGRVVQARPRDRAVEQQWRLETAAVTASKDGASGVVSANTEIRPSADESARETTKELNCRFLSIGDAGTIPCAYAEFLKIIDDQSCIVLPYGYVLPQTVRIVGVAELADEMQQRQYVLVPGLPILLRGWPTAGKVTGQRDDLSGKVFRVTGTEDVKKTDGSVIRVHVLELVK
jgi:probable HAF family extracellular repeat protein